MDRLAALESFARVAENGSFSKAAAKINVSKSLVSRQIAFLESDLQTRLFQRTTRSLRLTDAGASYYKDITLILSHLDEADRAVTHLQDKPCGFLRISAPMSFGVTHLSSALPDFLKLYPEIEIDIVLNDRLVDVVDEGFDMVLRIGRLANSSLISRKISFTRRIICASPSYLKIYGTPQNPDDLKGHRCVCYSNLSEADEWRFVCKQGKPWPVEVRGQLHANNGDLLRVAALAGTGIANLPTFIIGRDLQAGNLVSLLSDFVPQDAGIYALYPNARYLAPKVRTFIDFLAARFGAKPQWELVE